MTKTVRTRRPPPKSAKKSVKRGVFAHHQHTARLLPRRHTSYPLVALLLLMVGVLLTFSTVSVAAAPPDDITVTANYDGTVVPAGATILSPTNGSTFSAVPMPVSGTCQVGAGYYVKLFRNDIFSGSAACTSGGTFSISSDLFEGENVLTVQESNAANVTSPVSSPVTVYYAPATPLPPAPSGTNPGPSTGPGNHGTGTRFYISPDYFYRAGFTGQDVAEKLTFVGGQKPYGLTVNWGDGYSTVLHDIKDGSVTVRHQYKTATNVRTYYTVTVQGTDAIGRAASLQLFTVMNDPAIAGLAKKPPSTAAGIYHNPLLHGLLFAWPAYLVVLLMATTFWLGERRGESLILSRLKHRTARA